MARSLEMSGKAIWHLQNTTKRLATPLEELYSAPQAPSWWGGDWLSQ